MAPSMSPAADRIGTPPPSVRLPAAVKAMSMAVLMDVIFAESMRVKAKRCVCASTTAMLLFCC